MMDGKENSIPSPPNITKILRALGLPIHSLRLEAKTIEDSPRSPSELNCLRLQKSFSNVENKHLKTRGDSTMVIDTRASPKNPQKKAFYQSHDQ